MPSMFRDSYREALPKLEAEADLRMISVMAAGTGSLKANDLRQYMQGLRKRAGAVRKMKTLDDFRSAGFDVVTEEKASA